MTEQGLLRAKQSAAATTIQARWRGLATRKHVAARLHLHAATRAASIIQGHWRNYIPKLQKRKAVFKQQKATTIQCAWRQRQARRRVGALRDAARQRKAAGVRAEIRNDKAATACQCFWRTVLAVRRVRYLWLRRKERLEHKRRDRAAADMQRWMRGFLVRKNWGAIKAHQVCPPPRELLFNEKTMPPPPKSPCHPPPPPDQGLVPTPPPSRPKGRTPWAEVAFWIPPQGQVDAHSSADACLS